MFNLKDHWEFIVTIFAFGGLYNDAKNEKDKVKTLEEMQKKYNEDIGEVKEMLGRIDERTKKL